MEQSAYVQGHLHVHRESRIHSARDDLCGVLGTSVFEGWSARRSVRKRIAIVVLQWETLVGSAPTQLSQPVVDILDTVKDGVDSSDTSTIQSIRDTRPEQNSTGTGLMQLSAEVRMQIIDLFLDTDVLVMEAEISGESWARSRESIEGPELWRPFEVLMMTCRQLRLECLDILGQRTVTLDQQIRRTLLRLGSFLVHRHQNLDLIKFGQSRDIDTHTSVNIMAKGFGFQNVQPSTAWGTYLKAGKRGRTNIPCEESHD